uniref:Uncharacterized protein n=1 Tax=Parastrongyloides trichosuri TaxID=131310 RepID=A0A0N4ZDY2_PARTI
MPHDEKVDQTSGLSNEGFVMSMIVGTIVLVIIIVICCVACCLCCNRYRRSYWGFGYGGVYDPVPPPPVGFVAPVNSPIIL